MIRFIHLGLVVCVFSDLFKRTFPTPKVTKTFSYILFNCLFQNTSPVCNMSGIYLCSWLYNFIFLHQEISMCNLVVCETDAVICQFPGYIHHSLEF